MPAGLSGHHVGGCCVHQCWRRLIVSTSPLRHAMPTQCVQQHQVHKCTQQPVRFQHKIMLPICPHANYRATLLSTQQSSVCSGEAHPLLASLHGLTASNTDRICRSAQHPTMRAGLSNATTESRSHQHVLAVHVSSQPPRTTQQSGSAEVQVHAPPGKTTCHC